MLFNRWRAGASWRKRPDFTTDPECACGTVDGRFPPVMILDEWSLAGAADANLGQMFFS